MFGCYFFISVQICSTPIHLMPLISFFFVFCSTGERHCFRRCYCSASLVPKFPSSFFPRLAVQGYIFCGHLHYYYYLLLSLSVLLLLLLLLAIYYYVHYRYYYHYYYHDYYYCIIRLLENNLHFVKVENTL